MKVVVVGSPGSGKTTLAQQIAQRTGVPYLELDSLQHQPGWTELPREAFRARVRDFVVQSNWVIDGNYHGQVGDITWESADTVVWLDMHKRVVLRRVLVRTLRRGWTRQVLWNGNREHVTQLLKPRAEDNLLLWTYTQFGKYRARYTAAMADPAGPKVIRLCRATEVSDYLRALGKTQD